MTTKLVKITDCDHPSVEIEYKTLTQENYEVVLEQCKSEEDIIRRCKDAYGLINQYAPITRNVLAELKNCKVIARYGVGVDNIDLDAATEFGVQICNVPDYGVEEVSDHALALILNLVRKVNLLSNDVKKGNWDFQISRPIPRLNQLTLGVVGVGRIGSAVARKAQGLGWNVIGYDNKDEKVSGDFEIVDFETLLTKADIISIHTPLNKDTYHLINKETLNKMKDHVMIVNTARGPIIHESALVDALQSGKVSGVALDVLEEEPPVKDHPLLQFENAILTPHSAWYSEQSAYELKRKAAEEVKRFLNGEEVNYPVNTINNRGESFV
jgi:D-3-phosphoglycerate dehydrogenase